MGRNTAIWVAGAAHVVAPGLLTWGFSRQWLISVFHVVGFLMWRGRGLDGRRAPSSSWKPVFPAARAARGRQGRAMRVGSLTNMRARARRSGGEFAPTAWISAFHQFRLWLLETFDPGPSLSSVLVDSRNNLTFGRRVSATAP